MLYTRARIGQVEFVVPGVSELLLRDRDGSELLNRSRFDQYRRYAGSATVSYLPAGDAPAEAAVPPPRATRAPRVGAQASGPVTGTLDAEIGDDAAIGDTFTATTAEGAQLPGRITDMRRVGKRWIVELTLSGLVRRGLALPVMARTRLTWKAP